MRRLGLGLETRWRLLLPGALQQNLENGVLRMKRWLLLVLLGLPSLALIVAIVARGPTAGKQDWATATPITVADPEYREIHARWLTMDFQPLAAVRSEELINRVRHLPATPNPDTSALTEGQAERLAKAVASTLQSFQAATFQEFLASCPAGFNAGYDKEFIKGFAEFCGMDPQVLRPREVAQVWWETNMLRGAWARDVWQGVCWEGSRMLTARFTLKQDLDAEHHVRYLQDAIEDCGVVSTASIFVNSPSLYETLSTDGSVLIGSAVLLCKFTYQSTTNAFPLVLSFYSSPSSDLWFPYSMAWGFAGPVPPLPVF